MVQIIQKLKKLKNKFYNIFKTILKILISILRFLFKTIYPYRCASCKHIVKTSGFCASCWRKLIFINKPYCIICGRPLYNNVLNNSLVCANCLKHKYYFDRVFSVFVYNKTIAKAIFEFKFHEKTFLAKQFSELILKKLLDCKENIDFITCVPMHIKRLRVRGYNQSLLLANEISKSLNIPCICNLLKKIKHTKAQVQLNSKNRRINLKSSFDLNQKYINIIKNKNILIVDDVFTTGSTVNECAKVLKLKSKVNRIFITTIAKTTKI